jgi:O-acetylserine/cysteine efflux transporter
VVAAPVLLVMSFGFEDNVVERVQDSRADRLGLRGLRRRGLDHRGQRVAVLAGPAARGGRVTPYFLLTPLVSCTIGVLFMGDALSPQLVIGAAATMAGVALVAMTAKKVAPPEGEAT